MFNDATDRPIVVDDFIVYATKTEAPSLQFAWVTDIRDTGPARFGRGNVLKVKVTHANKDGSLKNKTVLKINPDTGRYEDVDTGKPNTSWLEVRGDKDRRMLKVEPYGK